MSAPLIGVADMVECISGVNEKLEGFVTVRCTGNADGRHVTLLGQIDPAQARGLATQYMEVAEAAESDQHVFRELVETIGLDDETAGQFIARLRHRRAEASE